MREIIRRTATETHEWAPELPVLVKHIYAVRGVNDSANLDKGLSQLLPYHALEGIATAVDLLIETLSAQQRILVVGDFDADGATSSALAVLALRAMGALSVNYLVPNRFEYGYGLTPEIVMLAKEQAPELLITVDNGISSHEGVVLAKSFGMRVLVTDHHLPGDDLPEADVIINPNLRTDQFQSKCLAGVGVVFYLMLALRTALKEKGWFNDRHLPVPNMAQFLDLVALGTVADVVPLDRNNRILVHHGVQRIRAGLGRKGIHALLRIAGKSFPQLTTGDLGFAVGPRLNAAGRLDDMSIGIQCLLSDDEEEALKLATQLDGLNEERRQIESEMQAQAFEQLKTLAWDKLAASPNGLCLFNPEWHQGVIGILASRIKDKLHRPVVVFAKGSETEMKGSARSISGIHIRDVFQAINAKYPHLIYKFGGHAMAAGLTIPRTQFTAFQAAFVEQINEKLDPAVLKQVLYSDGELTETALTLSLAELLRDLEPWGQGFPEPLFDGRFHLIDQRLVGGKHLKMKVTPVGGVRLIDAIAFNVDVAAWPNHRCEKVHIAYRLDINDFNSRRQLQLIIADIKECV